MTSKPHDKSMKRENSASNQDSSQGIDYGQLRNLLSLGLWKEADQDQETEYIMLKVSTRDKVGWIRSEDIENALI